MIEVKPVMEISSCHVMNFQFNINLLSVKFFVCSFYYITYHQHINKIINNNNFTLKC